MAGCAQQRSDRLGIMLAAARAGAFAGPPVDRASGPTSIVGQHRHGVEERRGRACRRQLGWKEEGDAKAARRKAAVRGRLARVVGAELHRLCNHGALRLLVAHREGESPRAAEALECVVDSGQRLRRRRKGRLQAVALAPPPDGQLDGQMRDLLFGLDQRAGRHGKPRHPRRVGAFLANLHRARAGHSESAGDSGRRARRPLALSEGCAGHAGRADRTGVRMNTNATDALCHLLGHAVIDLCDAIDNENKSPAHEQRRKWAFAIVSSLPVVCRALRDEAGQHAATPYILFYERVRQGHLNRSYFLEGVPQSVLLFAGVTTIALPDEQLLKLRLRDIVADRLATLQKLESASAARRAQLVREHSPQDVPDAVPGIARVFVARCRSVCRGVRRVKGNALFTNCSNANCRRLFYIGNPSEIWSNVAPKACLSDSDDELDSTSYWTSAACDDAAAVYTVRRFCSSTCESEFQAHLKRIMPGAHLEFDVDDRARKNGRARVAEAFKLALKRNEIASRHLRCMRARRRTSLAVDDDELATLVERHIAALNVDIGVLYAARIVNECSVLSRNKLLPGSWPGWRSDRKCYARVLSAVRVIYAKYRRREGVVHSLLTMPRFLQVVQARAASMF